MPALLSMRLPPTPPPEPAPAFSPTEISSCPAAAWWMSVWSRAHLEDLSFCPHEFSTVNFTLGDTCAKRQKALGVRVCTCVRVHAYAF